MSLPPRFRRRPPESFEGINAMEQAIAGVDEKVDKLALEVEWLRNDLGTEGLEALVRTTRQAVVVLGEQIASLRQNHGLSLQTLDQMQRAQNKALLSLQMEHRGDLNTIMQLNERINILLDPK